MVSNMSGNYGINFGGLVGQGPIFNFSSVRPAPGPRALGTTVASERGIIYFPRDYTHIDHHVSFAIKKFTGVTRTSSLQSDSAIFGQNPERRQAGSLSAYITLPMPSQLVANYNMDYANPTLSPIGELLTHAASIAKAEDTSAAVGSGINNITQAIRNQSAGTVISQAMTATQQAITRIFQTIQGAANPNAAGALGIGVAATGAARTGPIGQAVIANLTGVVSNPHKVILFQGVQHREHSFTFSLSPRNLREAKDLMEIIYQFKLSMHPKYGVGQATPSVVRNLSLPFVEGQTANELENSVRTFGAASRAFFEYPNVFDIEFSQADKSGDPGIRTLGKNKRLFTIGECVLQSFSVDYHPLNYPAYVASIGNSAEPLMPSQVNLTMRFLETDIVTKDQIVEYNR